MEQQPDFRELLALLNAKGVDFIVVGGYALAFHGAPRFTGDLDILVRPEPANAERIIVALHSFGFESLDLAPRDFIDEERVIQLGVAPVRIDLMTSLTGVSWDEADAGKISGHYGDVAVFYLGRDQLIKNKRAIGRHRDLADLEALGEGL